MRTTIYRDLGSAEEAWRRLEAASGGAIYPFQRYDWIFAWMGTVGAARGWEPFIALVAEKESEPRMLLPLGAVRERGLKRLSWLGEGVSDYAGPILAKDQDCGSEDLVRGALEAAKAARADLLLLGRVPGRGADGRRTSFLGPAWCPLHYKAHGLDLPHDLEAFIAERFSRKERYNLRRAEKKLAEEAGELAFAAPGSRPEDEEARRFIARAMVAQKRARYAATGAKDPLADPAVERFYVEAAATAVPGVETSALLAGGRPVATHWGVVEGKTAYFLMPTFDAAFERHSPGKIFLVRYLERCRELGIERLDLTVGDEDYKEKWQTDETAMYELVRGLSPRGAAAAARLALLRWLKAGPLLGLVRRLRARRATASRRPTKAVHGKS